MALPAEKRISRNLGINVDKDFLGFMKITFVSHNFEEVILHNESATREKGQVSILIF